MRTKKTYRFLLWDPTTGDHVTVISKMQTFSEAVSAAYIKQKELMYSTSKDYYIVGAFEVDAVSEMQRFMNGSRDAYDDLLSGISLEG